MIFVMLNRIILFIKILWISIIIEQLNTQQKELLDMDVDDIPEELIFTPIPLEARLSKGTKSVVNLA